VNYQCQTQSVSNGLTAGCGYGKNNEACINGVCTSVECNSSSDCEATNPCKMFICQSGTGWQCQEIGNKPDGTNCGGKFPGVCQNGWCSSPEQE